MSIDDQLNRAKARVQRRQDQAIAQQQERSQIRQAQIGERNTNGNYDLTFPDGGTANGKGIKLFDALTRPGDVVQVQERADGAYLLSGPKATAEDEDVGNNLSVGALMDRCDGYLKGQIFNCNARDQKILSAWAISTESGTSSTNVYAINLKSGQTYLLTSIPNLIQPCTENNPPPGPPEPEPPPTEGRDRMYLHAWVAPYVFSPPFAPPHCSTSVPIPRRPDTLPTSTFTNNLIHPTDGTSWVYRSSSGRYTDLPPLSPGSSWTSNFLYTYTTSPNPPALPVDIAFPVVSTGASNYVNIGEANLIPVAGAVVNDWVYASTGCADVPYSNTNSGTNPNFNRRPPPVPPIPNTYEMSISLDARGNPIAFIRHTPSCVVQGDWVYRRSFRIIGGQVRNYLGKLLEDWRYTIPVFTCQSTFATDLFANLNYDKNDKVWQVDLADRPAAIVTNNSPITIPVRERKVNTNCTTTPKATINVSAKATLAFSTTLVIRGIAVRYKKRQV